MRRWRRRLVTAMVAVVVGLGAGVFAYPHVREYWLIHKLGGDDPHVRATAIVAATALARISPRMVNRLEEEIAESEDGHFVAIVAVLKNLGTWNSPTRDVLQIDRLRSILFRTTHSLADPDAAAETRRRILADMLLSGRMNRHVFAAAKAVTADEDPAVRGLGGVLVAKVNQTDLLVHYKDGAGLLAQQTRLLSDDASTVVARTIMAIGLAGNTGESENILRYLQDSADARVVSAAAYAMTLLDPGKGTQAICARLTTTRDATLRDRLLIVAAMLDNGEARSAVSTVLTEARDAGRAPSPAMLLSAGRLGIASAGGDIRKVLSGAARRDDELSAAEVLAALKAARLLRLPVRAEVEAICRELWSPYWSDLLVTAAEMLGEQANMPQIDRRDVPSRSQCIRTLRQASVYRTETETMTSPTRSALPPATTPLPSAAAAVALWRMRAQLSDRYVRDVSAGDTALAGDYVAWRLGLARRGGAFKLAMAMCPPPEAPPDEHVYNDNERAAGAMLLGLSAATPIQHQLAVERVGSCLTGGPVGGEDSFYVRGAYRCALLVLGRTDEASSVGELLRTGEFPIRRAITALCAAGQRDGLDWLLWNPQLDTAAVAATLDQTHLGEVLTELAPDLPPVAAAGESIRRWQVGIMRDYYAIHRDKLKMGFAK